MTLLAMTLTPWLLTSMRKVLQHVTLVTTFKRNHNIEISQPAVSTITDKVFPLVKEWQSRILSPCYPIMYLDGMHFKVRDSGKITSKVAYIALGINHYGQKEVPRYLD